MISNDGHCSLSPFFPISKLLGPQRAGEVSQRAQGLGPLGSLLSTPVTIQLWECNKVTFRAKVIPNKKDMGTKNCHLCPVWGPFDEVILQGGGPGLGPYPALLWDHSQLRGLLAPLYALGPGGTGIDLRSAPCQISALTPVLLFWHSDRQASQEIPIEMAGLSFDPKSEGPAILLPNKFHSCYSQLKEPICLPTSQYSRPRFYFILVLSSSYT